MKKIKIGIDLDDTIWEFQPEFLKFYNNLFNKNYNFEDQKDYSLEIFLNVSSQKIKSLLDKFSQSEIFKKLPLIEGVLDFFDKIEKNYEIYFITSRPIKRKNATIKCFVNYFKNEKKIHFIGKGSEHFGKTKGDLCVELGITFMVDDHFENLKSCVQKGINCFLIDRPWNRGINLGKNITRVKNIGECINYLENYK